VVLYGTTNAEKGRQREVLTNLNSTKLKLALVSNLAPLNAMNEAKESMPQL
jgi:hypothetical protein